MAQYPTFNVGQRVTATLLQSIVPQVVRKPSTTSITSSTTYTLDPDLSVPVAANTTYFIEFWLKVSAAAAGDLKTIWDFPSGASGNRAVLGPSTVALDTDADNITMRTGVHGMGTTTILYNGVRNGSNQFLVQESGIIATSTTAGNITLSWAQGTSSATATSVSAGSFVRATVMP